jgi:hypothetical protein
VTEKKLKLLTRFALVLLTSCSNTKKKRGENPCECKDAEIEGEKNKQEE